MNEPNALPHYFLIRSAYDDPEISRSRLELSRLTIIPSLASQRTEIKVVLRLSRDDPFHTDRRAAFESACDDVRVVSGENWADAIDPSEPRLITRVDDDDFLAVWHSERLQRKAESARAESILYWPNGYVLADRLRWWRSETNQFQTLFTESHNPAETPFMMHHARVRDRWPVVEVDSARAWCWTRHVRAKSYGGDRPRIWTGFKVEKRPVGHFAVDFKSTRPQIAKLE